MIILVMFAGRIGLFTLVIAMSEEREDDGYNFPEVNLELGIRSKYNVKIIG